MLNKNTLPLLFFILCTNIGQYLSNLHANFDSRTFIRIEVIGTLNNHKYKKTLKLFFIS